MCSPTDNTGNCYCYHSPCGVASSWFCLATTTRSTGCDLCLFGIEVVAARLNWAVRSFASLAKAALWMILSTCECVGIKKGLVKNRHAEALDNLSVVDDRNANDKRNGVARYSSRTSRGFLCHKSPNGKKLPKVYPRRKHGVVGK